MIEFRRLSVQCCGNRILDGIDLSLPARGTAVILGPSGCGKTTLLKCAIREDLEDRELRVSGSILLGGEEVRSRRFPVHRLRQRVGLVSQQPVPFPGTAFENVTFAMRCTTRLAPGEIAERATRALEEVGLERQHWHTRARSLSGGQLKRLSIARTIALEPEALLFDEPSNGLDPLAAARIEQLIAALSRHRLVVVVTHDVGLVERIGDEVFFLWPYPTGSRLVEHGPARSVVRAPARPETRLFVRAAREGAPALALGEALVAAPAYDPGPGPCCCDPVAAAEAADGRTEPWRTAV